MPVMVIFGDGYLPSLATVVTRATNVTLVALREGLPSLVTHDPDVDRVWGQVLNLTHDTFRTNRSYRCWTVSHQYYRWISMSEAALKRQ